MNKEQALRRVAFFVTIYFAVVRFVTSTEMYLARNPESNQWLDGGFFTLVVVGVFYLAIDFYRK